MIRDIILSNPKISIILISAGITFFISLVNHLVLDKEVVKSQKNRQKELREEMKMHQESKNHEKMMEINKKILQESMQTFRMSMTPMLITTIPVLIAFYWIRNLFTSAFVGWFWWYLISAILFSILFRKLFKLP